VPAGSQSESRRVESGHGVTRLRHGAAAAATLIGFATLAMLAIHVLLPQRTGPLVFTQIFEPFLVLVMLVALLALTALARTRVPLILTLVVLVAATGRYGPSVVAFPAALPAGAQPISVMSWNLAAGSVSLADMSATIDRIRPDIVGLIELVPARSRETDDDQRIRALYPYRVMLPRSGEPGIGLLSRFPVIEKQFTQDPPLLRVVLAPSDVDPQITVFVAHPFLDSIDFFGLVPDVQTFRRDADITLVRGEIDGELAAGHDVLVLADFNVTEREPAYAELTRGLHDAQREAGFGFGLTWRPARIEGLPFGLLRIDYLLASSAFVALEAGPDCTPHGSDHCLVSATFARPHTR
jgi:vancomycin resistance protein VanJ